MTNLLAVIGIEEKTGASEVSRRFVKFANKKNIKTIIFNYKLSSKENSKTNIYISKFYKFFTFFKNFYLINKNLSRIKAAYIQENHGLGKVFDILFILLFIVNKKKCFYHNHSSSKYLRFDFLTKIIQLLSKFYVINIFLSTKELKKFKNIYGPLNKHYCISNSIFLDNNRNNKKNRSDSNILKFGLLSNLTKDKGLDKFIDLATYSLEKYKSWKFYLAGPIIKNKSSYLKRINNVPNLDYLGIINNEKEKISFYQNLDFFIFLTTYINESEPLVLLEATSLGCIPIVYDRGSISSLICSKKLILDKHNNPSGLICNLINEILKNEEIKKLSFESRKFYEKYKKSFQIELDKLLFEIKSI